MRYRKGSFIVVPNLRPLKGLDPMAQCLFVWLCHFANQDGECFPSHRKLQEYTGMSKRTVIRKMELLEKRGLISKIVRKKTSTKNLTNLYTVNIISSDTESLGSDTESPQVVTQSHSELYPFNYTHLTKEKGFKKPVDKSINNIKKALKKSLSLTMVYNINKLVDN